MQPRLLIGLRLAPESGQKANVPNPGWVVERLPAPRYYCPVALAARGSVDEPHGPLDAPSDRGCTGFSEPSGLSGCGAELGAVASRSLPSGAALYFAGPPCRDNDISIAAWPSFKSLEKGRGRAVPLPPTVSPQAAPHDRTPPHTLPFPVSSWE